MYVPIQTPYVGTQILQRTASFTVRNCSDVDEKQIRGLLHDSGNTFESASLMAFENGQRLCLPPQSVIKIEKDSLSITNPFISITFTVGFRGGSPKVVMLFFFDVVATQSGLYSQHPSMPDYKQWADRLINDARPWFGVL